MHQFTSIYDPLNDIYLKQTKLLDFPFNFTDISYENQQTELHLRKHDNCIVGHLFFGGIFAKILQHTKIKITQCFLNLLNISVGISIHV